MTAVFALLSFSVFGLAISLVTERVNHQVDLESRPQASSVSVDCKSSGHGDGLSADDCEVTMDKLKKSATARAVYDRSTNVSTGFATLDIRVSGDSSSVKAQAYASGFAEGVLTATDMADFYKNVYEFDESGPSKSLVEFLTSNEKWVREQVRSPPAGDVDYWNAVGLVLLRFDGMLAGYNTQAKKGDLPVMTSQDLMWVNLDGDLFDLQTAFEPSPGMQLVKRPLTRHERLKILRGFRCSALFKVTDDLQDVFFAHSTWDTYAVAAPRIYKHIELPVQRCHGSNCDSTTRIMSFSSSPGFLGSLDDWYLVKEESSGTELMITETSAEIYDATAYKKITHSSVLCWVRMLAANALAQDSKGWTDTFSVAASGTYNSQWMVFDLSKFTAGSKLPADTFWVLEEAPGTTVARDETDTLNDKGYFASYNVLKYDETRSISGEQENYDTCTRAELFKDMQGDVKTDKDMKAIIAWNDPTTNTASKDPMDAIMARGDLSVYNWAGGGIDAKISSVTHAKKMESVVRAGPTSDSQPAFCWKDYTQGDTMHEGHPDCFQFSWGTFSPANNV